MHLMTVLILLNTVRIKKKKEFLMLHATDALFCDVFALYLFGFIIRIYHDARSPEPKICH